MDGSRGLDLIYPKNLEKWERIGSVGVSPGVMRWGGGVGGIITVGRRSETAVDEQVWKAV